MITPRTLPILRAALLYWQEEICPHGDVAMRSYLEPPDASALSAAEVERLRAALASNVRYAVYDSRREQLDDLELFTVYEEAALAAGGSQVATVIVPADTSQPA